MKICAGMVAATCVAAAIGLVVIVGCESKDTGGGDPCQSADCDPLASCIADGSSYTCECPSGYNDVDGDGTTCIDIDECTEGLDDCDDVATCTNIDGGYTCECPTDYTDVNGDGTLCEPPACTVEGDSHAIVPGALPCCTGLVDVGCDAPDANGACLGCDGASFCTNCGDGICGLGENECRCPADCLVTNCTPEGQSHAVVPGAPPCCTGLVDVGCDAPDANGACLGCAGASYCTNCGDGICGLGENECRCPADCPP